MALEKDKVDDLIVDFVVRNEDDLVSNKKDNPALYDSVMSALSLLARKYGSGVQPAKIVDQYKPAPAPIVTQHIPSNALNFEVGDIFFRKDSSGKKLYIKEINTDTDVVLIAFLDDDNSVLDYTIEEVVTKFDKNLWVKSGDKFIPLPKKAMYFKVGDVFYHKDDKKEKYYIHSINKDANFVLVGSVIGSFSGAARYDLDEANLLMNNGTWIFTGEIHMPNNGLPFKEGDIFVISSTGKKYIFKSLISTKNKINGNDEYPIAKFDQPDVLYTQVDGKQIIQNLDKKDWKIVGNINDNKPAANIALKEGDIIEISKGLNNKITAFIAKTIDKSGFVEFADLEYPDVINSSARYADVMEYLMKGSWKITGNIKDKKPNVSPFEVGDIVLFVTDKENYLVRSIDARTDEILFSKIDNPNTIVSRYSFLDAIDKLEKLLWVIQPKSISSDPTIEEGDIIWVIKGVKNTYVVSMIKDGRVYLSDDNNPDVIKTDFHIQTVIKKLISGEWEKDVKLVKSKSVPKKTAGKTKKVVSPEEKELLDAIKALKPLLEFDSDVQKEIDNLNAKLAELRNKKD